MYANMIIFEGLGLWFALVTALLTAIYVVLLAISGIRDDDKIEKLQRKVKRLETSNTALINENWRYRLKYGELDPGKEVSANVRDKM